MVAGVYLRYTVTLTLEQKVGRRAPFDIQLRVQRSQHGYSIVRMCSSWNRSGNREEMRIRRDGKTRGT